MQLLARAVLAMCIAVTCAGCYEAAFPLDPAPQAPLDAKLFGTWRCISASANSEAANLIIRRARDGVYAASIVEDDKSTDTYEAYASVVGGNTVLNVQELKASKTPWVYGRYELLKPDLFQFQVASDDVLKGVEKSAAAVRRAIERQRADPALFEDGITCVRIKDAK